MRATYDIDPGRPVICQVSRFDRFKDPVGVIEAYRMAAMGKNAKAFVAENYLLTRHLREYLTLMVAVISGSRNRIELSCGI